MSPLRLRSTRVALAVAALTGLALSISRLLGAPGIESALVLALILPPFCAAIGARVVDADRGASMGALLTRANTAAVLVFALPAALLCLNLLRVPVCTPLEGITFLLLGPGLALPLSATLGVLIAAVIRRARVATTLAVLAPIAAAAWELWGFYSTPAIYAYGHLVGYFPGTLYDPDITVTGVYIGYRVLSLTWWLLIASALGAAWDPEHGGPSLGAIRERWPLVGAALLLLAVTLTGAAYGAELGHSSSSESIAEVLGGRLRGERCEVIFPRETPRAVSRRLVEDCDFRVHRVERVLGVRQPELVTAFFFRGADEKRALMGASNTYIAKPWRREVYLQMGEHPHPVLFHEIVHVVAGNLGRGPFRIAGSFGGLLPSPAIIEGLAVAVAWDARDGLTPHQWARAMIEVDLAPALSDVEGLEFLLQPASRAYTTSGSFVRWMMDTEGSEAARRLYTSGSFEEALGRPLEEAEADWRRYLQEEVELPEEARALARARFERPGIFGQICPHTIANLRAELGGSLASGDDEGAVARCHEILALDEGQAATRAALAGALARLARDDDATAELERLVGPPSAAAPIVWRARQEIADAAWRQRRDAEADAIYAALLGEPMGRSATRQLEVRRLGLASEGEGREALLGLLVPPRDAINDAAIAMYEIGRLDRARDDGLAAYLDARQLLFRQRYRLALPRIRLARERGLPSELTEIEARRMEAMIALGAGDLDASRRGWWAILRDDRSTEGERVEARDWLARIRDAG